MRIGSNNILYPRLFWNKDSGGGNGSSGIFKPAAITSDRLLPSGGFLRKDLRFEFPVDDIIKDATGETAPIDRLTAYLIDHTPTMKDIKEKKFYWLVNISDDFLNKLRERLHEKSEHLLALLQDRGRSSVQKDIYHRDYLCNSLRFVFGFEEANNISPRTPEKLTYNPLPPTPIDPNKKVHEEKLSLIFKNIYIPLQCYSDTAKKIRDYLDEAIYVLSNENGLLEDEAIPFDKYLFLRELKSSNYLASSPEDLNGDFYLSDYVNKVLAETSRLLLEKNPYLKDRYMLSRFARTDGRLSDLECAAAIILELELGHTVQAASHLYKNHSRELDSILIKDNVPIVNEFMMLGNKLTELFYGKLNMNEKERRDIKFLESNVLIGSNAYKKDPDDFDHKPWIDRTIFRIEKISGMKDYIKANKTDSRTIYIECN